MRRSRPHQYRKESGREIMEKSNPPESGRARGAHSPSHGNNENDAQQLPDSAAVVNRKLIEREHGVLLDESGEGARASYTVTCCGEARTFSLRWQAESCFARLVRRRTPKPEKEGLALAIGEPVPRFARNGRGKRR
jgi:hypothetical protein